MAEVIVAEATGHAGGNVGVLGPLVQLAMAQAVVAANALGVADDTPAARVLELTGVEGKDGAEYIRDAKMSARGATLKAHRGLHRAHEGARAAEQHAKHVARSQDG